MNKVIKSVKGQEMLAEVKNERHLSKVDKSRPCYNVVKPCKFFIKYSPEQRAVLTSLYIWQLFTQPLLVKNRILQKENELFEIQIIGLEQDVLLLTKEALWKK